MIPTLFDKMRANRKRSAAAAAKRLMDSRLEELLKSKQGAVIQTPFSDPMTYINYRLANKGAEQ